MLKLGETGISALRLGGTEIKKAYLGSDLVFEGEKTSRLPEGYTEVEYIYPADYRATINTKFSLKNYNVEVVIEYASIVNSSYKIFDARNVSSGKYYVVQVSCSKVRPGFLKTANGNTAFSDYGGVSPAITPETGKKYAITYTHSDEAGGAKIDIDGSSANIESYSTAPSPTGNVILGGGQSSLAMYIRYYSFRIFYGDGSIVFRDLVPCIDPSGAVGMYDLAYRSFYGPASASYKWLAGPAV